MRSGLPDLYRFGATPTPFIDDLCGAVQGDVWLDGQNIFALVLTDT
jgi:hypothetical protein